MTSTNLHFFNKFGHNLNLQWNTELGHFEGNLYFNPISNYLFDNENLFILEKVGADYKFPTLAQYESLEFSWVDNLNSDEWFLYTIEEDIAQDTEFINKIDLLEISQSDFISGPGTLDLKLPLQVNIAFSPTDEAKFERTLEVWHKNSNLGTREKIAQLYFYGEGIEEEERFKTWSQNFGIKFLKEDANILKDYDIKEAFPDVKAINQARKELLVNKDQIYPYIGTYRGLSNFINILGYKNTLQIKEYWNNVNPKSQTFGKQLMVDISDYLDDSKLDSIDFIDANKKLKDGAQFRKTEFLAIVYQFTRATDVYDDDGIPIIETTTDFTVNEIFYKLNLLNSKVKNEFLPINVKIKDIIGEFIYFQKYTISNWQDSTKVFDFDLNEQAKVDYWPSPDKQTVKLLSLNPLFRNSDPEIAINIDGPNPFEFGQIYNKEQRTKLAQNIREFYYQVKQQRSTNINSRLSWEVGDDPERVVGVPVILTVDTGKFTINDLKNVQLSELDSLYVGGPKWWTLENLDNRNFYEVNWIIRKNSPNPYSFNQREKLADFKELPHILPYAGTYHLGVELYDFYGNVSTYTRTLTIDADSKPEIIALTRLEDKFDYSIGNLSNVQLKDFGSSPLYYPKINVLDSEDSAFSLDVYKGLLDTLSFYKNRYGLGQNMYDVDFYNEATNTYVDYFSSTWSHEKKDYWGLGTNKLPISLKDLAGLKIEELYFLRIANTVYLDDFSAGFYLNQVNPGEWIQFSQFDPYYVPYFSTELELISILNESEHPAISLFNYDIVGPYIHATAKYLGRDQYQILYYEGGFSPSFSPYFSPFYSPLPSPWSSQVDGDKYTFFLPNGVYSKSVINLLKSISPLFEEETLFLYSKTSDQLTGAVQDPSFWESSKYCEWINNKQRGYLPTILDQNAFNPNDTKMYSETFYTPEDNPVFFVVNNIEGKSDFIWTLYDSTNTEVVRVKSVPFFVWKFKDLGDFTLKCEVFDNVGGRYVSQLENFIRVLDKKQYITSVESRLNSRKANIVKSLPKV